MESACLVSGSLAWALRVACAVGMAPLKFQKAGPYYRISISPVLAICTKIFFVFCCITWISASIINYIDEKQQQSQRPGNHSLIIHLFNSDTTVAVMVAGVFTGKKRMASMVTYLKRIHEINLELNSYRPMKKSERNNWIWIMVSLVLGNFILGHGVYQYFYDVLMENQYLLASIYLFHLCTAYIQIMIELMFSQIALHICSTIRHLTLCLEDILEPTHDLTKREEKVRQLGVLYIDIIEVVRQVDKSHGLVLLVCIISTFQHILFVAYNILKALLMESTEYTRFSNPLLQTTYCILQMLNIILIVEPGHQTQEEFADVRCVVIDITQNTNLSKHHSGGLELLFQIVTLNNFGYSPIKMFILNRKLLVSIIGSIVTYLTIMVDF